MYLYTRIAYDRRRISGRHKHVYLINSETKSKYPEEGNEKPLKSKSYFV